MDEVGLRYKQSRFSLLLSLSSLALVACSWHVTFLFFLFRQEHFSRLALFFFLVERTCLLTSTVYTHRTFANPISTSHVLRSFLFQYPTPPPYKKKRTKKFISRGHDFPLPAMYITKKRVTMVETQMGSHGTRSLHRVFSSKNQRERERTIHVKNVRTSILHFYAVCV